MKPNYNFILGTRMETLLGVAILVLQFSISYGGDNPSTSLEYSCVIDAGSSGSRIRIYTWEKRTVTSRVPPDVTEVASLKVKPGIASYANDLSGLEYHLGSLIAKGKEEVPSTKHSSTPLYLMATAGKVN